MSVAIKSDFIIFTTVTILPLIVVFTIIITVHKHTNNNAIIVNVFGSNNTSLTLLQTQ